MNEFVQLPSGKIIDRAAVVFARPGTIPEGEWVDGQQVGEKHTPKLDVYLAGGHQATLVGLDAEYMTSKLTGKLVAKSNTVDTPGSRALYGGSIPEKTPLRLSDERPLRLIHAFQDDNTRLYYCTPCCFELGLEDMRPIIRKDEDKTDTCCLCGRAV